VFTSMHVLQRDMSLHHGRVQATDAGSASSSQRISGEG
jgi:hypothetical protein